MSVFITNLLSSNAFFSFYIFKKSWKRSHQWAETFKTQDKNYKSLQFLSQKWKILKLFFLISFKIGKKVHLSAEASKNKTYSGF